MPHTLIGEHSLNDAYIIRLATLHSGHRAPGLYDFQPTELDLSPIQRWFTEWRLEMRNADLVLSSESSARISTSRSRRIVGN